MLKKHIQNLKGRTRASLIFLISSLFCSVVVSCENYGPIKKTTNETKINLVELNCEKTVGFLGNEALLDVCYDDVILILQKNNTHRDKVLIGFLESKTPPLIFKDSGGWREELVGKSGAKE